MDEQEIRFKQSAIVSLARDVAALRVVWNENVVPIYMRYDFIVRSLPDAASEKYNAVRDEMITAMHTMARPLFDEPEALDDLLALLGFRVTDELLGQVAQTMRASFNRVELDESTRPVAEREARARFIEANLAYDSKKAKQLMEVYEKAKAKRTPASKPVDGREGLHE